MFKLHFLAPALLLAITAASCSSNPSTEGSATGLLSEDDYCNAYASEVCETHDRCCSLFDDGPPDSEGCRAKAKAECESAVNDARSAGRSFHGEGARLCLLHLEGSVSVNCHTMPEENAAADLVCEHDVYRGSTPLGGSCQRDDDCAPHPEGRTACDTNTPEPSFTCVLPTVSDVEGPCLQRDDDHRLYICRDGFTCDASKRCSPLLGLGYECGFGPGWGECNVSYFCIRGICRGRPGIGGPCEPTIPNVCGTEAFCNSESGTCEKLLADGESCSDSEQCQSRRCQGTCQPRIGLGKACDPEEGALACSEGYCDEKELVCKALLKEQEACSSSIQCEWGRCEGGLCLHAGFMDTTICGVSGS